MLRHGGRFPLAGRGDINTYAVFAELGAGIINPHGRTGMILPTGIATDDTTKFLFGALVTAGRLADLVGFENEEFVFPAVDHRVTFCKLTIVGSAQQVGPAVSPSVSGAMSNCTKPPASTHCVRKISHC